MVVSDNTSFKLLASFEVNSLCRLLILLLLVCAFEGFDLSLFFLYFYNKDFEFDRFTFILRVLDDLSSISVVLPYQIYTGNNTLGYQGLSMLGWKCVFFLGL